MITCESGDDKTGEFTEELSEEQVEYAYVVNNMLTNTDRFLENDEWSSGKFKAWHLILLVSASILIAFNVVCCFIRIRVPRTKTEIVANSKRRALLKNFRVNITSLKAADLDDMDYKRALEKLREDYKADDESIAQSEAISIMSYD